MNQAVQHLEQAKQILMQAGTITDTVDIARQRLEQETLELENKIRLQKLQLDEIHTQVNQAKQELEKWLVVLNVTTPNIRMIPTQGVIPTPQDEELPNAEYQQQEEENSSVGSDAAVHDGDQGDETNNANHVSFDSFLMDEEKENEEKAFAVLCNVPVDNNDMNIVILDVTTATTAAMDQRSIGCCSGSVATPLSISTTAITCNHKKKQSSKQCTRRRYYSSPKKWRRMIRTSRLQSILLE